MTMTMMSQTSYNRLTANLTLSCIIIFSLLASPGSAFVNLPQSRCSTASRFSCHHSYNHNPHQTPFFGVSTRLRNFFLRQSSDPNEEESTRNPLQTFKNKNPILVKKVSAPARTIWSGAKFVLRFKWTIVLLLILLGKRFSRQATPYAVPIPACLLAVCGTILVDLNKRTTQIQQEDEDKDWTPLAQSKARLFWQIPMQRKRKETSNDYIYRQDESSKKFASSDIRQKFTNFMFGLRKMSRYMVEKTTIYVLECENGKYYIGSTVNMKRRMQQHFDNSRGGSVWTRKYKPIRVVKVYKRIPYRYKLGFEAQVTAELMWEKGINNVRGAMYLYSREYNAKDIDSLVSFIGHYNDLSYTYVRQQLFKELSGRGRQVDNAKTRRKEQRKHLQIEYQKKTENINHDDERYEASQCKDDKNSGPTTDTDDEDDTGDDRYKAMDAWLNRNIDEW